MGPVFLERQTYRRRRIMDAGRFLPFVGAFLFLVPVLWAGTVQTTSGIFYIFGLWLILIGIAGLLSRKLAQVREDEQADAGEG